MLTRAAAAAVGQAVTPALLQLLLPVMADEIVIGAASVPDPPFVVEDPSYRKVCRHTVGCAARCVRLSFSKPSTSQAFLHSNCQAAGGSCAAGGKGACACICLSSHGPQALALNLFYKFLLGVIVHVQGIPPPLPARDCRGGRACVCGGSNTTRRLRHSRRCFTGLAAVDPRLASAVGHYERPISDGATSFGETGTTLSALDGTVRAAAAALV